MVYCMYIYKCFLRVSPYLCVCVNFKERPNFNINIDLISQIEGYGSGGIYIHLFGILFNLRSWGKTWKCTP